MLVASLPAPPHLQRGKVPVATAHSPPLHFPGIPPPQKPHCNPTILQGWPACSSGNASNPVMEWPQRIQTAARKENIPPALNCRVAPKEQRNIQKNVDVDLFLPSGSHLGELWTRPGSSIRSSKHLGESLQRGLRATCGRGENHGPCQTNLSCPAWGLPKASLVHQQNNLESSLRRRRWEGGNLKGTPPRDFPETPHHVPRNPPRMKTRERYLLKGPHELFTGSRRRYQDLRASRESSSPTRFSGDPSRHSLPERCPLSMTHSGVSDSSPPVPSDGLKHYATVDGHSSPEVAQTLLRSSRSSADQWRSLHGLQKERSSFSWEPHLPSWVPQPAGGPQTSTMAVREIQALVKARSQWRTMLSSTLWMCREDCSRKSSGTPQDTLNELRDQGYLRRLDPEERHSGTFCGSELHLKNCPLDVSSLGGLERSLKALHPEASPKKRLFVEDPHGEKPPTLDPPGAPEVPLGHPVGKKVGDLPTHKAGDTYGETGRGPIITSSVEEAGPLSAHQKVHLLEGTIWKGPNSPVWPPLLRKDGGLHREGFVLLENKKLRDAFNRWRSHCEKKQQLCLLAFRIQSGLIGRCFKAWQSLARRTRHSKAAMEHLRAQSLRVSFRQWCLMVQARRRAKRAMIELLWARRPSSCGPRRDPKRRNWPPKYGEHTLDSLFHLRMLQEAFLTWKTRWREAQRAGAFYRDSTLRQLREALARWRWRSRVLNPLRLAEGSLLASADLQESSPSSSALPSAGQVCVAHGCGLGELAASPSWSSSQNLGQVVQLVEPSCIGLSSSGTVGEPSGLLAPVFRCPRCSFDHENPSQVADEDSPSSAASKYGRLWKRKVQLHHFRARWDARQLAKAWRLWKDACSAELVVQTLVWQRRAERGWKIWRRRWLQLRVAQRFREAEEEHLLKRAFGKWRRLAAVSRVRIE